MVSKAINGIAISTKHVSKRIVFSYIIDWILILATAAVGGAFSKIQGNRHAFSLDDLSISFPHKPNDTVSFAVLMVVSIVAPGIITFLVSLIFVPGPTASRSTPKSLIWRRRLWEWNTAWMGLGVAVAGAFMVTEGLKDLAGKPRPDLLARCNPDLSNVNKYRVGGLGGALSEAVIVVDWHICQQTDQHVLRDGFASWPSGHSSFSWAGMLYLTLFLCAKFAISIPFLAPTTYSRSHISTFHDASQLPETNGSSPSAHNMKVKIPPRNQAAAPPVYLMILAFVPIGAAFFICVSRYSDYRHAGFDIISGAVIGAVFAWIGFRMYHLPIRQGAGWAWGARSRDRAYYLGLGIPSYVGEEGWDSGKTARVHEDDPECGPLSTTRGGVEDHSEDDMVSGSKNTNHLVGT